MANYEATVEWRRSEGDDHRSGKYSRAHRWLFDGGADVPASASPLHAPPPLSDPAGIDPEEALVAALASCHMLFFLFFAGKEDIEVLYYRDEAVGEMGKRADGKTAMIHCTLRPKIEFGKDSHLSAEQIEALHHSAHEACYIANSVNFPVTVEPVQ